LDDSRVKVCDVLLTAGCKPAAGEVLVTAGGTPSYFVKHWRQLDNGIVTVGEVLVTSTVKEGRVTTCCEELLTPGRKDMDHCSVSLFLNGIPHKLYLS
jgi:hypothetical protein